MDKGIFSFYPLFIFSAKFMNSENSIFQYVFYQAKLGFFFLVFFQHWKLFFTEKIKTEAFH